MTLIIRLDHVYISLYSLQIHSTYHTSETMLALELLYFFFFLENTRILETKLLRK
jgi:hypothetical protein